MEESPSLSSATAEGGADVLARGRGKVEEVAADAGDRDGHLRRGQHNQLRRLRFRRHHRHGGDAPHNNLNSMIIDKATS